MKLLYSLLLFTFILVSFCSSNTRFLDTNTTSGNSTNSNNSNSSSSSTDSFINIFADDPVSRLSSSDRATLNSWIDWKNSWPRYNSKFDPVPKTFALEQDYYKSSILALGIPFFLIGGIIMFIGILFGVFRYGLGRCGGKNDAAEALLNVTRFKRHCTFITTGIAILLWFCGMVVSLTGTMKYHNNLKSTEDSLTGMASRQVNEAQTFWDVSQKINNQKLTYPNDTTSNYTLEFYSYDEISSAAKSINNGAGDFVGYLNSDNNVFQGFLWVFFIFGFALCGLISFAVIKKMGGFTLILGLFFILFSSMAFGLSGFFFSQCFKVGDICQQNTEIVNKVYPDTGAGIFDYVPCYSSKYVKDIIEVNNDGMNHLALAIDFYFSYLNKSSFTSYYPNIHHHSDIIALYKNATFAQNENLTLWGGIITDLANALYGLENLRNCVGPRQYSVDSEANMCLVGLPGLYLGFVGILIQAIAFFFLIFAAIQMKSVLEKLKADSESTIHMRQANYS